MANAHTIVYRNVSVGGNRQKWTLSMWWKFNPKGETYPAGTYYQRLYDAKVDGDFFSIFETGANRLKWYSIGAAEYGIEPKREFRDTVWYHTVLRVDTTSASDLDAADRYRLYVNGVQETEFNWQVNPPQGYEGNTNKSTVDMVHGGATTDNYCWNGVMSHIHMCDGYSYAPTEFGEFDSTSGIWKIKASPSLSYGTNGYWLKFENSSNMDLDSSSNNLTFTTATQAGGGLTLTKDNPSNNFCVLNGTTNYGQQGGQLKNGCTTAVQSSTGIHAEGNMGMPSGKWYWEIEMNGDAGDFGVCENGRARQSAPTNNYPFYLVTNPGTTTTSIYNNARSNPGSSTFTGTA